VAGLGKQRGTVGQLLKGTAEDIRAAAAHSIRSPLATGVPELDSVLDGGGMERAALGVAIGGPGAGKSLYLCGLAAAAMVEGHDVAYMSLELSEQQVKKRIYANLYDMTAEDMAAHPEKAAHRHQALKGDGVGNMHVIYDTAGATTPSTYKTWLRSLERDNPGFKPEVLIVDYADLMVSSSRKNDMRMYEEMKIVYEQLRSIAVERDCWIWTASQAARGGLHKKRLDLEHIADSINKARIADIVVSIARTSEDEAQGMVRFRVPKRREGAAHSEIGPLTMDASHGRMVMMARRNPW
jgi:replicative DNA helicase